MSIRKVLSGCSIALLVVGATAAPASAQDYEWSIGLDCSICHSIQYESLGLMQAEDAKGTDKPANEATDKEEACDEASLHAAEVTAFASMHGKNFGFACTVCHTDTPELAAGHKKLNSGKNATRLKKSSVSEKMCLACHKADALAEATADSVVLTDTHGTIVNPHDLPANDSHDALTCFSCHTVHPGEEDEINQNAFATCVSCHHEKVFECGTCHE